MRRPGCRSACVSHVVLSLRVQRCCDRWHLARRLRRIAVVLGSIQPERGPPGASATGPRPIPVGHLVLSGLDQGRGGMFRRQSGGVQWRVASTLAAPLHGTSSYPSSAESLAPTAFRAGRIRIGIASSRTVLEHPSLCGEHDLRRSMVRHRPDTSFPFRNIERGSDLGSTRRKSDSRPEFDRSASGRIGPLQHRLRGLSERVHARRRHGTLHWGSQTSVSIDPLDLLLSGRHRGDLDEPGRDGFLRLRPFVVSGDPRVGGGDFSIGFTALHLVSRSLEPSWSLSPQASRISRVSLSGRSASSCCTRGGGASGRSWSGFLPL